MSDSRTRKAPSQDGLGLALVGFGGLASVSIVLAMTGQEPREGLASVVTSPVVGLIAVLGSGPSLAVALAFAGLGSIAFLLPAPLAVGRHSAGIGLVGLALALLAGGLVSGGGGAVGGMLPDLLGALAGRIAGGLIGVTVFLAALWGVWGAPMPRFSGLARETGAPLAASRYEDAAGVSTAESEALVGTAPAEPPPRAVPLRHEAAPTSDQESPRAHDAVERGHAGAASAQPAGEPARADVAAVDTTTVVALERSTDGVDGGSDAGADPAALALADDEDSDPSTPAPPVWEVSDSIDDAEEDEEPVEDSAELEQDDEEYEDAEAAELDEGGEDDDEEYEEDDSAELDEDEEEYEDAEAAELDEEEEDDEEYEEDDVAAEDEEYDDDEDEDAEEDEFEDEEAEVVAEEEEYEDEDGSDESDETEEELVESDESDEQAPEPASAEGSVRGAPKDWEQAGLFDEDAPAASAEADSEPEYVLEPAAAEAAEADEATEAAAVDVPALDFDDLVHEAGLLFLTEQRVAVSMLQKEFALDFDRSCSVLDTLQERGLIGPYMGGRTREILLTKEEWAARTSTA